MRHIFSAGVFCLALLAPARGYPDMTRPLLGYIWDPGARTVRAVEGVPGASFLGQPVDFGMEIQQAIVAPDGSYVLTVSAGDGTPAFYGIVGGAAVPHAIEGAMHPVDRIAMSPSGTAAVLYNASTGVLQVVTGLPETPTVTREITSRMAGRMAVSDDGALLLLASASGGPGFIALPDGPRGPYSAGRRAPRRASGPASGAALAVPVQGPVSAMAFRPESHDALIAGGGRITLIRALGTDSSYEVFDEPADAPVALAFSNRGGGFFAAYADGRIRSRNLASGDSSVFTCPCVPSGLRALGGDSVFQLNEAGRGPLFLVDGRNNRVVFVPGVVR